MICASSLRSNAAAGSTHWLRRWISRSLVAVVIAAIVAGDAAHRSGYDQVVTGRIRDGETTRICAAAGPDLRKRVALEQAMGRPITCSIVFSDSVETWAEWESPWFAREPSGSPEFHWASWVRDSQGINELVITHSLIPARVSSDWRARGAAGEYDDHARRLAEFLVGKGLGESTIRLAHEPNGDWFRHHIGDTEDERRDWAAFWRRTVWAMRAVPGADFRFDLSINPAYRPIPIEEYYPGDDVVDIIGVDQYDSLPSPQMSAGASRWKALVIQPMGLDDIRRFAEQRGKRISIPEYSLIPDSLSDGAGDNPAYIDGLAEIVAQGDVAYVGSFESSNHELLPLADAPASLEAWRRHFGDPGRNP